MRKRPGLPAIVLLGTGLLSFPSMATATTATLFPDRDNTLFEDTTGSLSNGAGGYLFAGATAGGVRRRALLHFDLSGLPAGATITAATLRLVMSQTSAGPQDVQVHRLQASWGEGTSNSGGSPTSGGGQGAPSTANDATWIHRFFPGQPWAAAGGDFAATVSASQTVADVGTYDWTGGSLASDVQGWLGSPGGNLGWILMGEETAAHTAKRFNARENEAPGTRPQLILTYTTTTPVARVPALGPARWWLAALLLVMAPVLARPSRRSGSSPCPMK
jgi:hypothetical protein